MPNQNGLILGSASPRRAELLHSVGCDFEVVTASVDECALNDESPLEYLERITNLKAEAVWQQLSERKNQQSLVVLCADTIVVHENEILGKPADFNHAVETWGKLSNSEHSVFTGLIVRTAGNRISFEVVETQVQFDAIDYQQMQAYWNTGEPQDKAGGYAIQGLASAWVKAISGSYSNVVGLPLRETNLLLRDVGLNWL